MKTLTLNEIEKRFEFAMDDYRYKHPDGIDNVNLHYLNVLLILLEQDFNEDYNILVIKLNGNGELSCSAMPMDRVVSQLKRTIDSKDRKDTSVNLRLIYQWFLMTGKVWVQYAPYTDFIPTRVISQQPFSIDDASRIIFDSLIINFNETSIQLPF